MKRHRLSLIILSVLLFSVVGNILPQPAPVSAANDPTGACRQILATALHKDVKDIPATHPFIQTCIKKGYPTGYLNPTNNDDTSACPNTDPHLTYCQAGFKKGQQDAKAASGTTTPSASTIKSSAEKACQPYRDQDGLSSADRTKNFNACVAGYTGQLTGKDVSTSCRSYSGGVLAACIKGHDAAVDKKPIVPGTASVSAPAAGTTGTNTIDDGSDDKLSLDCNAGFNPLNWLVCGMIKGMVSVLDGVDKVINNLLSVGTPNNSTSGEPTQIFKTGCGVDCKTGEAYHGAWASFRNIALGLLVMAGLIMIIAQALGMEILDAYTIRKVLPRLIIVSIGITLSWPVLSFIVQLFNDLGYGVRFLIESPFKESLENSTINLSGGGTGTAVALATPLAFMALGIFGLLTFVGSALLAALIAFLVLVIRQVVVILLVITAPVALVCYILPNTQKAWKLWFDSFSGALLMFPIIAAMIAAGRAFAAVATNGGAGDQIGSFVAFAAYFGPYFIIPATFKFAGGAIRQIGGFVNDRSRGGFDRLRKARQDNTGRRIKAARSGGIYRDDFGKFTNPLTGKKTSVSQLANKAGNWTFDFDEQARVSLGQSRIPGGRALFGRSSDILKGQIEDRTIEHSKKALQEVGGLHYQTGRALGGQMQYFAGIQNPDGTWQGGDLNDSSRAKLISTFGNKDAAGNFDGTWRAPTGKKDIEALGSILSEGGAKSTMAAQELLAKAPLLGAFKGAGHEETQRADLATMGLMAAAQAGRLETDEIAASRSISDGDINQPGLGSKRAAVLQQLATQKRNEQREGHGIQYRQVKDKNGQPVFDPSTRQPVLEAYSVYENPFSTEAQNAIMSMTSNDIAGSKSETIDSIAQTMKAGASEYVQVMGVDDKGNPRVQEYRDPTTKRKVRKTGEELQRAKAMQDRIQYLAMYSQGDSDAGRKLGDIMKDLNIQPSTNRTPTGAPAVMPGGPPAQPTPPANTTPIGGPPPA